MTSFLQTASLSQMYEANWVRTSRLFDMGFYVAAASDSQAVLDPALHYVVVGEAAGLPASRRFRAADYRRLNPDLAGEQMNLLYHFEAHGLAEGRLYASSGYGVRMDASRLDAGKPTVLLLASDAEDEVSQLGCRLAEALRPMRNVVVVVEQEGRYAERLAAAASALVGPLPADILHDGRELRHLAGRLRRRYAPRYAVANGFHSQALAISLREAGTPVVALVHRFLDRCEPQAVRRLYEVSDALVFPSEAVREDSVQAYGLLRQRRTYLLPCGLAEPEVDPSGEPAPVASLGGDGLFEVVGLGPTSLEGGLDIFIATAAALERARPGLEVRFTWLSPEDDDPAEGVEAMLRRQLTSSGLQARLQFARTRGAGLPDGRIDALLLCARGYAIPTMEAEAAANGVPLLCLSGSAVFAELLLADPRSSWLVAPSEDVADLVAALVGLVLDPDRRALASSAMRRLAQRAFDMAAYAQAVDALGLACAGRAEAAALHADHLVQADFSLDAYFRQAAEKPLDKADAARRYLHEVRSVDFTGPAVHEHHPVRALPGFNPFIYARTAPGYEADRDGDPLAHFTRMGRPAGPWAHAVIRLDTGGAPPTPEPPLRAAIHGHFHYTDNIDEFLQALAANASRVDLLLTTTNVPAAERLSRAIDAYAMGEASVEITPNLGRDIGPFIQLLGSGLRGYDVVAHVHGKRSLHAADHDADFGNRWRNFLWRQLIGPSTPVMDVVLAHFGRDPRLGMVFPENEQFLGWEKNRASAALLAPRLGLGPLPEHIEFPAGTMFWVRPQALDALLEADFQPGDYPPEPLADDGTMLHALERMLPSVVNAAGFDYATTYHPALTRLARAGAGPG